MFDITDPLATQRRDCHLSDRTYPITLEALLWAACDDIADRNGMTTTDLLAALYDRLPHHPHHASSVAQMHRAIPVFLVSYYRHRATFPPGTLDAAFDAAFPEMSPALA
jgi:predicted DNA-binding ribbon-helix-helix protein